ncbi:MAG: omega-amidase [Flavobacteriales bacterium]
MSVLLCFSFLTFSAETIESMTDLNVCVLQADLAWENPQLNYERLAGLMSNQREADIIVLPEMFTTGFSMEPALVAETHGLSMETLEWMKRHAALLDSAITGSISVQEEGKYYNRLYWVEPDGTVIWYDKNHLFSFAGEDACYTAGTERLIVEWRGWKVLPLICYDLRFPELARNGSLNGNANYDLCIYVANWPGVRSHPWSSLLVARAIENQCYLVGCNRVGQDGKDIDYAGDSIILNSRGELLAEALPGKAQQITASLSMQELLDFRAKFPVLEDQKKA